MPSQSQMEQRQYTQFIPPKGNFEAFRDDDHYKEKLKEWGLSSAKEAKREFWYKDRNFEQQVTIIGFEVYGSAQDGNTLVIEFKDGHLSCVHPAYLKEMQQGSFSKGSMWELEEKDSSSSETGKSKPVEMETKGTTTSEATTATTTKSNQKEANPKVEKKAKKEKAPKLELPLDKVHFTATVKQFAMTYNPFNEENDEVVVLENVTIQQEEPLEITLAWCSHSKTLKKFELTVGELLEFDGKVVAKKLAKGKDAPEEFVIDEPVLYKINNPSKIIKKTE